MTFLEGLEKSYHNTPGYVCLRDIGHSKKKMMVAVIKSEEGSSTTGNSLMSVLNVAVLELSVGICASGNHLSPLKNSTSLIVKLLRYGVFLSWPEVVMTKNDVLNCSNVFLKLQNVKGKVMNNITTLDY